MFQKNLTQKKNTPTVDEMMAGRSVLQERAKKTVTSIADKANEFSNGQMAKDVEHNNVTAFNLFYQWVKGTGYSERIFTENSVMGEQMLKTPEVTSAIDSTLTWISRGALPDTVSVRRSVADENFILYPISFFADLTKNPARAYHGSFSGSLIVDTIIPFGKNDIYTEMTIKLKDKNGAESGFRPPGELGGYSSNTFKLFFNNPYGSLGQFRTITTKYELKIIRLTNYQPGLTKLKNP